MKLLVWQEVAIHDKSAQRIRQMNSFLGVTIGKVNQQIFLIDHFELLFSMSSDKSPEHSNSTQTHRNILINTLKHAHNTNTHNNNNTCSIRQLSIVKLRFDGNEVTSLRSIDI